MAFNPDTDEVARRLEETFAKTGELPDRLEELNPKQPFGPQKPYASMKRDDYYRSQRKPHRCNPIVDEICDVLVSDPFNVGPHFTHLFKCFSEDSYIPPPYTPKGANEQ
eukprot:TRINITY_DN3359_c0_g1_i2.p1 TRINITY_DN3359_c0_g1~~TRINITY_DN3359_c0_g1_i2.p1  ORF type:complete len:109 (+),score=15.77 TRINITY_DN3359_c0_g1_i2:237-563(+)